MAEISQKIEHGHLPIWNPFLAETEKTVRLGVQGWIPQHGNTRECSYVPSQLDPKGVVFKVLCSFETLVSFYSRAGGAMVTEPGGRAVYEGSCEGYGMACCYVLQAERKGLCTLTLVLDGYAKTNHSWATHVKTLLLIAWSFGTYVQVIPFTCLLPKRVLLCPNLGIKIFQNNFHYSTKFSGMRCLFIWTQLPLG